MPGSEKGVCALVMAVCGGARGFRFDNGRPEVTTRRLELAIEPGAVVYLRDLRTGQLFCEADVWEKVNSLPSAATTFPDSYEFRRWHY